MIFNNLLDLFFKCISLIREELNISIIDLITFSSLLFIALLLVISLLKRKISNNFLVYQNNSIKSKRETITFFPPRIIFIRNHFIFIKPFKYKSKLITIPIYLENKFSYKIFFQLLNFLESFSYWDSYHHLKYIIESFESNRIDERIFLESIIFFKVCLFCMDFTNQSTIYNLLLTCFYDLSLINEFPKDHLIWEGCPENFKCTNNIFKWVEFCMYLRIGRYMNFPLYGDTLLLVDGKYMPNNFNHFVCTLEDLRFFVFSLEIEAFDPSMENIPLDFLNIYNTKLSRIVFLAPIKNLDIRHEQYVLEINGISLTPFKFLNISILDGMRLYRSVSMAKEICIFFGDYLNPTKGKIDPRWLHPSSFFGCLELNCCLYGNLVIGVDLIVEGGLVRDCSSLFYKPLLEDDLFVVVGVDHDKSLNENSLEWKIGFYNLKSDEGQFGFRNIIKIFPGFWKGSYETFYLDWSKDFLSPKANFNFNFISFPFYCRLVFKNSPCIMKSLAYRYNLINSFEKQEFFKEAYNKLLIERNSLNLKKDSYDNIESFNFDLEPIEDSLDKLEWALNKDFMRLSLYVCFGGLKHKNCMCYGSNIYKGFKGCLCLKEFTLSNGLFIRNDIYFNFLYLPSPNILSNKEEIDTYISKIVGYEDLKSYFHSFYEKLITNKRILQALEDKLEHPLSLEESLGFNYVKDIFINPKDVFYHYKPKILIYDSNLASNKGKGLNLINLFYILLNLFHQFQGRNKKDLENFLYIISRKYREKEFFSDLSIDHYTNPNNLDRALEKEISNWSYNYISTEEDNKFDFNEIIFQIESLSLFKDPNKYLNKKDFKEGIKFPLLVLDSISNICNIHYNYISNYIKLSNEDFISFDKFYRHSIIFSTSCKVYKDLLDLEITSDSLFKLELPITPEDKKEDSIFLLIFNNLVE